MKFGAFLGGDYRKWPWDSMFKADYSRIASDVVKYAAHLVQRAFVMHFHYDSGEANVRSWLTMDVPGGKLNVGDSIQAILLGAGTDLRVLAVHNRTPKPGTTIEVQVFKVDGTAVGAALSVDLSTAGYSKKDLATTAIMDQNGWVEVKLVAGDLLSTCFDVYQELVHFHTDKPCNCMPEPCTSTTLDPLCVPPVVTP